MSKYNINSTKFQPSLYPTSPTIRLAYQAPVGKRVMILASTFANVDVGSNVMHYLTTYISEPLNAVYAKGTDFATVTSPPILVGHLSGVPIPFGSSLNGGKLILQPFEGLWIKVNPRYIDVLLSFVEITL